jgi:hypothetical protein
MLGLAIMASCALLMASVRDDLVRHSDQIIQYTALSFYTSRRAPRFW